MALQPPKVRLITSGLNSWVKRMLLGFKFPWIMLISWRYFRPLEKPIATFTLSLQVSGRQIPPAWCRNNLSIDSNSWSCMQKVLEINLEIRSEYNSQTLNSYLVGTDQVNHCMHTHIQSSVDFCFHMNPTAWPHFYD